MWTVKTLVRPILCNAATVWKGRFTCHEPTTRKFADGSKRAGQAGPRCCLVGKLLMTATLFTLRAYDRALCHNDGETSFTSHHVFSSFVTYFEQ